MKRKIYTRLVRATAVAVATLFTAAVGQIGLAAGDAHYNEHADVNVSDRSSVLRGAVLFSENCMGCHSASMQRYNRLAKDYNMNPELLVGTVIKDVNTGLGDHMVSSLDATDAEQWLGKAPPDLTLIARAKSADYVYNFLRGFYLDTETRTGFNNIVLHNTAMPNVLARFQGEAVLHEEDGHQSVQLVKNDDVPESDFKAKVNRYDRVTRDITNFLVYISEPGQEYRKSLGYKVIFYLFILSILLFFLKKAYWRHIH